MSVRAGRSHRRAGRVALCIVLGCTGAAHAQSVGPVETAQSRELFAAGVHAAQQADWHAARDAFERAYRLNPQPIILFNLAGARAEMGQLLGGADGYRRFLQLANGTVAEARRADAVTALAAIERRIPHARIAAVGLRAGDTLVLDEDTLNDVALAAPLPLDPGPHRVVVLRAGHEVARTAFTLAESASIDVALRIDDVVVIPRDERPPPAATVFHTVTPRRARPTTLFASPWLWTAVGLVVVTAVLVPVAIVATGPTGTSLAPFRGNADPPAVALP